MSVNNQEAVELLAKQIVQTMRELQTKNNQEYVDREIKNTTISADNIRGLGRIVSEQVGNVEVNADNIQGLDSRIEQAVDTKFDNVTITSADIQDLQTAVADIIVAEIQTANIEWANITNLNAAMISAVVAEIQRLSAGQIEADQLNAAIAKIAQAEINSAKIDLAQIYDLIANQAIITQGVAGELYIARLAVTEANMVSLSVGELLLRGPNGGFYALIVDEEGNITTELKQVGNDDVADLSLDGGQKIIDGSITAKCLNVEEIFANDALIGAITAGNLAAGSITSVKIESGAITAEKIDATSIETRHLQADAVTAEKIKADSIEAKHLQADAVTADKIKADSIETKHLQADAVTADKIKAGSIETDHLQADSITSEKIEAGAITAEEIAANAITTDKIAAKTITVEKLASEVGKQLDLSSNASIAIQVNELRDEIASSVVDAAGQQLIISFAYGNAFELGKEEIKAKAQVLKNGEDITDKIPPAAFFWERVTDNSDEDKLWNELPEHRGVKEITLLREDVGKSCSIRCLVNEDVFGNSFLIENGELIYTPVWTDSFSLQDGSIYGEEGYFLKNGCVFREAKSNPIEAESGVFDHSVFESSGIYIKEDELKIKSSGSISMEAGSALSMEGAEISMKAGSAFKVESGGIAHIDAEDGHVNLGDDFSVTDEGSLVAKTGSFADGLRLKGQEVNPGPEIIVSTAEPEASGIIWLKPSSVRSVSYGMDTGNARNTMWYDQATSSQSHTFTLAPDSGDRMTDGNFLYTFKLPLYEIREARQNVKITVMAQKASGGKIVVFPEYNLSSIRQWQEVIVEMKVESGINLGGDAAAINVTVAMDGVESNNGLYLQRNDRISLSMVNETATDRVMPCEIFWKP